MFGHDVNQQAGAAPVAPTIPDSVLAGIDQPLAAPATVPNMAGFAVPSRSQVLPPTQAAAPAAVQPAAAAPVDDLDVAELESELDTSAVQGINSLVTQPTAVGNLSSEDLLAIKQQALQDLSPLVDQLDQTPEERFRTTMMLIQASDNDSLIKSAFEAAQQIADEKIKAQALLDVVNEINYFTQKANGDAPQG